MRLGRQQVDLWQSRKTYRKRILISDYYMVKDPVISFISLTLWGQIILLEKEGFCFGLVCLSVCPTHGHHFGTFSLNTLKPTHPAFLAHYFMLPTHLIYISRRGTPPCAQYHSTIVIFRLSNSSLAFSSSGIFLWQLTSDNGVQTFTTKCW